MINQDSFVLCGEFTQITLKVVVSIMIVSMRNCLGFKGTERALTNTLRATGLTSTETRREKAQVIRKAGKDFKDIGMNPSIQLKELSIIKIMSREHV